MQSESLPLPRRSLKYIKQAKYLVWLGSNATSYSHWEHTQAGVRENSRRQSKAKKYMQHDNNNCNMATNYTRNNFDCFFLSDIRFGQKKKNPVPCYHVISCITSHMTDWRMVKVVVTWVPLSLISHRVCIQTIILKAYETEKCRVWTEQRSDNFESHVVWPRH